MTASKTKTLSVELASVVDRDDLVAEIWIEQDQMAELRLENGEVLVQLFPCPTGGPWDLPCADLLAGLLDAQRRVAGER